MLHVRNLSGKKVSKVPGVVSQVAKRGEVQFYACKVKIYSRRVLHQNFNLIGQILTKL